MGQNDGGQTQLNFDNDGGDIFAAAGLNQQNNQSEDIFAAAGMSGGGMNF